MFIQIKAKQTPHMLKVFTWECDNQSDSDS